ncbi:MAG: glycosyltransferase family 2 protein [Gemmatimonadota bacterium]|jgi:glycosyltransferase involved in cell wall biosynthesis
MSDAALVSAVICTRDRRRYLERSLVSLLQQSAGAGRYEILVVDNASRDDTAAYLAGLDTGPIPTTILHEATTGLSRARNLALSHARGTLIAFLDDDAVAAHDWIERIRAAFAARGDGMAGLAGRVEAIWESTRPDWLSGEALGALAVVDWGPDAGPLTAGQYVVGANMAFRTAALREVGGFPEHLGRIGGDLLSGEETFVADRLAERGRPVFYDPSVIAHHHVQAERLTRGWLVRRAFFQGVSRARADTSRGLARQLTRSAGLVLRMPACLGRALYFALSRDPARRFDERLYAIRSLGELATRARLSVAPYALPLAGNAVTR